MPRRRRALLPGPEGTAAEKWLHPDDLVDDRALTDIEDDEFGLKDVVDEVASLCESTALPATLALYGSWGSGKSSLANLLEKRFERHERVAFARFDAFKYAEVPLRRHFLSQLASAYGVKDKDFSEKLYESSRDVRIHVPGWKWKQLLGVVLVAVLGMALLAAIASLAIVVLSKGAVWTHAFWSDYAKTLRAAVPAVALAAPALAAALALLGKVLTADVTTEAPSSEEQFEELFKDLVKKAVDRRKCERLVIFIDELDRCSPAQVVTALETLRTFLEVKPCVFVVAADRQALEHALTESARQATPLDTANPYYSAGSAYLDKIFQYQLQLPPILPRRLSRYALDLIEGRGGVWGRVANRPELVSVLIPTHVRSPRRVKTLLNSFALLYRLALLRAAEGTIDGGVEARASEVAKLVCLRTEFPLFANDLQLYSRLPDVVLLLHEEESPDLSRFRALSDETRARARAYAQEKLPVDQVIAQPVAVQASAPSAEASLATKVEASHAKQLIRYLQKTREVASPGTDLIYLESLGAAFDLPAELAQQLEADAVDGKKDDVAATFQELDEGEQNKAYRLLARLVVEAVGIEARNVAQALFAAIAARKGDLTAVADDLLTALVTYNTGYELEADDLSGALALALSHDGSAAQDMRRIVLNREELVTDVTLALQALSSARQLRAHRAQLGNALTAVLHDVEGVSAERALEGISEDDAGELVKLVAFADEDVALGLADFIESAQQQGRAQLAMTGFRHLLASEDEWALDAAESRVAAFAPITATDVAAAIVEKARQRSPEEWATWLDALDVEKVASIEGIDDKLDSYVETLWEARTGQISGQSIADDVLSEVGRAIGRLRPDLAPESETYLDLVGNLSSAAIPPQTATRGANYNDLWTLANSEALPVDDAAQSILEDLQRTIAAPQAKAQPQAIADLVEESIAAALAYAPVEAVAAFASAIASDGAWLPQPCAVIVRVEVDCALRELGAGGDEPPRDALTMLVDDCGSRALEALARWAEVFRPNPVRLYDIVSAELKNGTAVPAELDPVIRTTARTWTPEQKADLLDDLAPGYVAGDVDDTVIRTFGLADADPERASEVLIRRFESVTNNDERGRVLDLWQLVSPTGTRAQTKLIDHVYLPLLTEGKGAIRIALDHFAVVQSAPSNAAQERVKRAIKAAASGTSDISKKADRLLRSAGWISGKRKWLPWK